MSVLAEAKKWLSCVTPEEATRLREEAAKLKASLKEIGQWSVEILNADCGAVHHELREFAEDCYGRVTDALGGQPLTISLETACERILGKETAQAIIADQGLRWAIVAAVAAAQTTDDAEAIALAIGFALGRL